MQENQELQKIKRKAVVKKQKDALALYRPQNDLEGSSHEVPDSGLFDGYNEIIKLSDQTLMIKDNIGGGVTTFNAKETSLLFVTHVYNLFKGYTLGTGKKYDEFDDEDKRIVARTYEVPNKDFPKSIGSFSEHYERYLFDPGYRSMLHLRCHAFVAIRDENDMLKILPATFGSTAFKSINALLKLARSMDVHHSYISTLLHAKEDRNSQQIKFGRVLFDPHKDNNVVRPFFRNDKEFIFVRGFIKDFVDKKKSLQEKLNDLSNANDTEYNYLHKMDSADKPEENHVHQKPKVNIANSEPSPMPTGQDDIPF